MKNKYVLRVYTENFRFENSDNNICLVPKSEVNRNDILFETTANTGKGLKKLWEDKLAIYKGYTYCIKNLETDTIMVSGVYDMNDIKRLEKALADEVEKPHKKDCCKKNFNYDGVSNLLAVAFLPFYFIVAHLCRYYGDVRARIASILIFICLGMISVVLKAIGTAKQQKVGFLRAFFLGSNYISCKKEKEENGSETEQSNKHRQKHKGK